MEHVRKFYGGYGDMPPWGKGPVQYKIHSEGRAYIEEHFPHLDRFLRCQVELSSKSVKQDKKSGVEKEHKMPKKLIHNDNQPLKNLRENGRMKRLRRQAIAAKSKFQEVIHDASSVAHSKYQHAIHEVNSMAKTRTLPTVGHFTSESFFYIILLLIVLLVGFLCKKTTSKNLKKN